MTKGYLDTPCPLADGQTLGAPLVSGTPFGDAQYQDDYTGTFGSPVSTGGSIYNNETFTVNRLKAKIINTPWTRKHWYKVTFYHTGFDAFIDASGNLPPITSATQVLRTGLHIGVQGGVDFGALKPHCPNLTAAFPNYTYKVEYLGEYRNQPSANMPLAPEPPVNYNLGSAPEPYAVYLSPIHTAPPPKSDSVKERTDFDNISSPPGWDVSLYPNPVQEQLTVESSVSVHRALVYDIFGRVVLEQNFSANKKLIFNTQPLKTGVYLITLINVSGETRQQTFVKQ